MPVVALPTAGIWSQLHLRTAEGPPIAQSTWPLPIAGQARPAPPPPPPSRPRDWSAAADACRRNLATSAAQDAREAHRAKADLQMERRAIFAPDSRAHAAPPAPVAYPRESAFVHSPIAKAPLGSGYGSSHGPPSVLSPREQLLLSVVDWSVRPRAAAPWQSSLHRPPTASAGNTCRNCRCGCVCGADNSGMTSSSGFASGSGATSSDMDQFSSSAFAQSSDEHTRTQGDRNQRPLFNVNNRDRLERERDATRMRHRPNPAAKHTPYPHSGSIQAPPITSSHEDYDPRFEALWRNEPLQPPSQPSTNPFVVPPVSSNVFGSPLTARDRTDMSSLLGLTPGPLTLPHHNTTYGGSSFAPSFAHGLSATGGALFSESDQSWLSPSSSPNTRSLGSSAKAHHLAESARVRMQLRAEQYSQQRLSAIPASSGSGTSGSEFHSSSTSDFDSSAAPLPARRATAFHPATSSSSERDSSAYLTSSLLSVTRLSDS